MDRNTVVDGDWVLTKIEDDNIYHSFDCGDSDLNEYFQKDIFFHKQELLTQSYYVYVRPLDDIPLALLDFCNDALHLERYQKNIRYTSLPAVKLTRFGVCASEQGKNIGTHVLNMVKEFFVKDNRTGCRFITVDAYNRPRVIKFYEKNGFKPVTVKDKDRRTRSLYFDLKRLSGNYK